MPFLPRTANFRNQGGQSYAITRGQFFALSTNWDRIGIAWSNRDGGFTVQLHSIPLDGRIVLTKPKNNG